MGDFFKDWSLRTKLLTAAGTLAAVGTVINSSSTLAEQFPLATKGYVMAQLDAGNKPVLQALLQIQWTQAIDRYNLLDFQIGQLTTQIIMLADSIRNDPTRVDIEARKAQLADLQSDKVQKEIEQRRLRCQIAARDAMAACP